MRLIAQPQTCKCKWNHGVLFLVVWGVLCTAARGDAPSSKSWVDRKEEIEAFLKNARIVSVKGLGRGITHPEKVELTDGNETHAAVFKPIEEGRSQGYWESYQAEIAAYELDKLLGLDMVPPTVQRTIRGQTGSLQWWIRDAELYAKLKDHTPTTAAWSHQLSRMKLFDCLIGNEDRNAGNFLVDRAWNIILIDHSRAFLNRTKITHDAAKLPVQFDRALVERMRKLDLKTLKARFKGLLREGYLKRLLKRRDELVAAMTRRVEKEGEGAVLYGR